MIPINLVFQWYLIFDTQLKLRYLLSDLKILTQKNPGWSVRNKLTQTDPDLVDDDEEIRVHRLLISKRMTMRDLKKRKN